MKEELLELLHEIKEIYTVIMNGDVLDLYSLNENHLEELFTRILMVEIDNTAKPVFEELYELNRLLVQRINMEKDILVQEQQLFEKQKMGAEHYSNPQTQRYESYFIDKNW